METSRSLWRDDRLQSYPRVVPGSYPGCAQGVTDLSTGAGGPDARGLSTPVDNLWCGSGSVAPTEGPLEPPLAAGGRGARRVTGDCRAGVS